MNWTKHSFIHKHTHFFFSLTNRPTATHCRVQTTKDETKPKRKKESQLQMNGLWVVLFALIMNLAKSSRLHANKLKLEFVQSPLVSYNIFCFAYSSAASYSCTRYTHVHCSLAHAILFFRFRNSITNKKSTIITKTKKKISNSVAANEQNKIDSKNTVNKSWQKKIYTDTYTLSLSLRKI